ncbi:hypothetical protein BUALT_Bualt03G0205100 [Buddleja alternifolia]|uniref:Uncharacterized protein n=1 Tax=Buddleja alternifolia TaxID=168488 RepID=A0AAV6XVE1_9LAMI|nr:hypothetical protein BUALT_Bualt03G0205100 [Buddleja alternifolia]
MVFTGSEVSWTCIADAVDSDLLADHFVWAATDPKPKNQTFNINNGDVFKWKHLWSVLAQQFDLEATAVVYKEPLALLLEDLMKDKDSALTDIAAF